MFFENIITTGIIFGLISMMGWGVGDYVIALASRKVGNIKALFYSYLLGSIILILFTLIMRFPFNMTAKAFLFSLVAGILHVIAGYLFYKGLIVGKISLVSPIASSYSFILVLFGLVFFQEKLSFFQTTAIIGIIIGSIFTSLDIKELISQFKFKKVDPGIPYAFATMLFWAIGFLFLNQAVKEVGVIYPTIVLYTSGLIFFLLYIIVGRFSLSIKVDRSIVSYFFINGVGSAIAYVSFSLGVEKHYMTIIAPIAAAFPLITILLAILILKERVSLTQLIGVLFIITGIIALSVF